MTEPLWTPEELAERLTAAGLPVTRRTIIEHARDGEISTVRAGKFYRIPESVANSLVEEARTYTMSIPALAKHAGVSEATVRKWVATDKLPYRKLFRWVRFRPADVEDFLRQSPT